MTLLEKEKSKSSIPKYFLNENNEKITNGKEISSGLNTFFANVGSKLAEQISTTSYSSIYDYFSNPVENSLFLAPIVDTEIISIVNNFKGKTSNDCDNLDMAIVKKDYSQYS